MNHASVWVVQFNFPSAMYRFVFIEVLLLTENDVVAKSPLSDYYKLKL